MDPVKERDLVDGEGALVGDPGKRRVPRESAPIVVPGRGRRPDHRHHLR
jgi:hypothetical protein